MAILVQSSLAGSGCRSCWGALPARSTRAGVDAVSLSSTSRIQAMAYIGIYLVLRVCTLVSRLSRETQQV